MVEAAVAAQVPEEFLESAPEVYLLPQRLHLLADASDLPHSDPVDFPGVEVGGGRAAHRPGVELLAAREGPDPGLRTGPRQVFVRQVAAEPGQGRDHLLLDQRPGLEALRAANAVRR